MNIFSNIPYVTTQISNLSETTMIDTTIVDYHGDVGKPMVIRRRPLVNYPVSPFNIVWKVVYSLSDQYPKTLDRSKRVLQDVHGKCVLAIVRQAKSINVLNALHIRPIQQYLNVTRRIDMVIMNTIVLNYFPGNLYFTSLEQGDDTRGGIFYKVFVLQNNGVKIEEGSYSTLQVTAGN